MDADEILRWLERRGRRRHREAMARYAIHTPSVYGVPMATLRPLARRLGRDHALALALWRTGWLEARMLAALVDESAKVTPRQMDQWAGDFDNWAVCDNACMHLFVRTPHAWRKARQWSRRRPEFVRRAGFALMASLAIHDKRAPDADFAALLPLLDAAADDRRNFVKKAVAWARRQIDRRLEG